jgi:hypothetical protein
MGCMVSSTLRTLYPHYAGGGLGLSAGVDSCGESLGPRLWRSGLFFTHYIYLPIYLNRPTFIHCRSQRPRGLRRGSAAACLLGLWVRIPPGAWLYIFCECCVLGGVLCDRPITRPEESYGVRCVWVWPWNVSHEEGLSNGAVAPWTKIHSSVHLFIYIGIYKVIYSSIRLFILLFGHSYIHLVICLLIYSFLRAFFYLFICGKVHDSVSNWPHSVSNWPHSVSNWPHSVSNWPHSVSNWPHSVSNWPHSVSNWPHCQ